MTSPDRDVPRSGHGAEIYRPKGEQDLTFPVDRTALLVIDPVNDFLSEGGAGWDLAKSTVQKHDVVGHLQEAIEGARQRGVPVLFAPMAYTREDYEDQELQRRSGINRIMFERKMFLAGSWGADFHPDLRPRDDEVVLLPHKGIDVFETDLPEHLERLGVMHLVIAGMTANLCCESTGRHAMEHGYDVTFLRDAIGAENLPAYEASIRVNYPLIANAVLETGEFLEALDAEEALPREGDQVVSSDHMEIGTVEAVSRGEGEKAGHLLVPRGMVLRKDTYIPLDAVVKRVSRRVFVNVPRIVVGDMPWDHAPRKTDVQEKRGPARDEVDRLYGSRSPSTADR
ncbi:MAG: cysteine hydrolase [Actinomycetota bacterium]|nr:cysteine hydrolase [Actinomycetota bacterium]